MFGLSLVEILFLLVLALVVLGPEKLPPLARQIGRFVRQVRQASSDLRQLVELEGLRDDLKRIQDPLNLKRPKDPYGDVRAQEEAWKKNQPTWKPPVVKPEEAAPPLRVGAAAPEGAPSLGAAAGVGSTAGVSAGTATSMEAAHQPPALAPERPLWSRPLDDDDDEDEVPSAEQAHGGAVVGVASYRRAARKPEARALGPWVKAAPLPARRGLGSLDVGLAVVELPECPVEFLASLRAVKVAGGAAELWTWAYALEGRAPRELGPGLKAAPLRVPPPGSRASWGRARVSALRAAAAVRAVALPAWAPPPAPLEVLPPSPEALAPPLEASSPPPGASEPPLEVVAPSLEALTPALEATHAP
jgi:sec-independent protein translocase protein TatB